MYYRPVLLRAGCTWCVWSFRPSSPLRLPHLKCLLCYVPASHGSAALPWAATSSTGDNDLSVHGLLHSNDNMDLCCDNAFCPWMAVGPIRICWVAEVCCVLWGLLLGFDLANQTVLQVVVAWATCSGLCKCPRNMHSAWSDCRTACCTSQTQFQCHKGCLYRARACAVPLVKPCVVLVEEYL